MRLTKYELSADFILLSWLAYKARPVPIPALQFFSDL